MIFLNPNPYRILIVTVGAIIARIVALSFRFLLKIKHKIFTIVGNDCDFEVLFFEEVGKQILQLFFGYAAIVGQF